MEAATEAPPQADVREKERQKRRAQQLESHEILTENTQIMFENLVKYLQGELLVTSSDYKLLHQMNAVTRDKYVEMTRMTSALVGSMTELQEKYKEFAPYLQKIDDIDASVAELERVVLVLDEYTKRLEAKFEQLKRPVGPK